MCAAPVSNSCMTLEEALRVLHGLRTEQVVITSMGTAREWPKISNHPLDFHYVPSAMGQVTTLGLGVALAQPEREVIACCGDGSLLMNLGSLVTIANENPPNLTVILFDNGMYEVTGGQKTAAAEQSLRSGRVVDWVALARGAGIEQSFQYVSAGAWASAAADCLTAPGPRFVALRVADVGAGYALESPGPISERLAAFRMALVL